MSWLLNKKRREGGETNAGSFHQGNFVRGHVETRRITRPGSLVYEMPATKFQGRAGEHHHL